MRLFEADLPVRLHHDRPAGYRLGSDRRKRDRQLGSRQLRVVHGVSGQREVQRDPVPDLDRRQGQDAEPGTGPYWSSVLEDGTVYFVQGHPTLCGIGTKIVRFRNGTTTILHRFPDGIEIADLDAVERPAGPVVYFTRINCSRGEISGIYRIDG